MRFEDVHKVRLFRARDLQLCPSRKDGHLDHHLGVGAKPLQVTDGSAFRFAYYMSDFSERKHRGAPT